MVELIKSKLTYDDRNDMHYQENDLEGLIDNYYNDQGLDSEGKEKAD